MNKPMSESQHHSPRPHWYRSRFAQSETDPLTGFANIMDVMLVFAVGLMLAIVTQSKALQKHFQLEHKTIIETGSELVDAPELMEQMRKGNRDGMKPLGQVYRDPKTGKLILIDTNQPM